MTRVPHSDRCRIVVTGLAATYPFGGVFWDYMQYALGFHQLGHDVLYLEDTGKWCYSPTQRTFVESGADQAAYLEHHLEPLGLGSRWSYRDATGRTFGMPRAQALAFCREADLFLHISASCWMREEYFAARTVAFVDSDPMYTQASLPAHERGADADEEEERVASIERHDVWFTFAENIDGASCRVPKGSMHWRPTRQPIVLDRFEPYRVPVEHRRRLLTTVGSWEPHEKGPVVDGQRYGSKRQEFERFLALPRRSPVPIELAMSGNYPAQRLRDHGWRVREALEVSSTPGEYRDYLAGSLGEWSVAKHAYVAGRTGWFSCRSACYLALGVPVVVQDTGFSHLLPTGRGVLSFQTMDEAVAAIESVAADPGGHAEAAREIAREFFDAREVLGRLLEVALNHDRVA